MSDEPYKMRAPCSECGCEFGILRTVGFQDTIKCHQCGKFQYNAPRKETGKPQLHVPMREKISPALRAEVLTRASCACEICHRANLPLSVGHLLSIDAGKAAGMSESELNSEENLAAMCDACNLGIGKQPVPLRIMIAIITTRCALLQKKIGM
jgi:hypothetical protein